MKQRSAAANQKYQEKNAHAAKKLAEALFPDERWLTLSDRIYLSSNRRIGANTNFQNEKRDAEILCSFGHTVYLVPEESRVPGRKYDAIVSGMIMEFKNVGGTTNTLQTQFLRSREQAPNVFLNMEMSSLSKSEIMRALHGARNTPRYDHKNKFPGGGLIILKVKGHKRLVYLNVEDLNKKVKKPGAERPVGSGAVGFKSHSLANNNLRHIS